MMTALCCPPSLLSPRYSVCDFLSELRRDCLPLYSACLRGPNLWEVQKMWVRRHTAEWNITQNMLNTSNLKVTVDSKSIALLLLLLLLL